MLHSQGRIRNTALVQARQGPRYDRFTGDIHMPAWMTYAAIISVLVFATAAAVGAHYGSLAQGGVSGVLASVLVFLALAD